TFVVGASDNCSSTPVPSITPPSGSFFGFGTSTVSASAADGAGNLGGCSFAVTVLTPAQQVDEIGNQVATLVRSGALGQGQGSSLLAKLNAIKAKLQQGQAAVAC